MEIVEFFEQLESEYRNQPWPWPRSMTGEELAFWRSGFPTHCDLIGGAFIGGDAVIQVQYPKVLRTLKIDLESATVDAP